MFGFSIFKIIFTIAVVIAVWQGFKWLKRRDTLINARTRDSVGRESRFTGNATEEMISCPDCGAYVAKGASHRCN